jgi:calcium-dependent protein kinase
MFKAYHRQLEETRAVNIISKVLRTRDSSERIDFLREFGLLKSLDHPNILRFYEFFEDKLNYYIITEYCKGGELFEFILENRAISE